MNKTTIDQLETADIPLPACRLLDLTLAWARYVEDNERHGRYPDALTSTRLAQLYQEAGVYSLCYENASPQEQEELTKSFLCDRVLPLLHKPVSQTSDDSD